jgi:predicted Holliday junction resolvase-like endonuclease
MIVLFFGILAGVTALFSTIIISVLLRKISTLNREIDSLLGELDSLEEELVEVYRRGGERRQRGRPQHRNEDEDEVGSNDDGIITSGEQIVI